MSPTAEVVHNDSNLDPNEPKLPKPPRVLMAIKPMTYYCITQSFAILLTISCPRTTLWRLRPYDPEISETDDILNMDVLSLFAVTCLAAFSLYYFVNKSDPGYVTLEGLGGVSEDEETGLIDVEVENCFDMNQIGGNVGSVARGLRGPRGNDEKGKEGYEDDDDDEEEEEDVKVAPSTNNNGENSWHGGNELNRQLYSSPRRKFCSKCGFAPPLRSHHCRICDKCVATFDHHCMMVDTCVGERNHCRFWWWLLAQSVCCWTSVGIISR